MSRTEEAIAILVIALFVGYIALKLAGVPI